VFIPENDADNKSGKFSIEKKVWKRKDDTMPDGWAYFDRLPDYFGSRDAIIPVLRKQNEKFTRIQWFRFREKLCEIFYDTTDASNKWYDIQDMAVLFATAEQLCVSLLMITEIWSKFPEKDLVELT